MEVVSRGLSDSLQVKDRALQEHTVSMVRK